MTRNRRQVLVPVLVLVLLTPPAWAGPVITSQPQTQAVVPGSTASFTVKATGTAPLSYQWQVRQGSAFSDLADRTNAVLVLTNVQPWHAADYRVTVTNASGAISSAVAHLHVMSPGMVMSRTLLDNFDDDKLTDWFGMFGGKPTETNQQLTIRGYWPDKKTWEMTDTLAAAYRSWPTLIVQNFQTLEWRVDVIDMNDHTDAVYIELVSSSTGVYPVLKGHDFILIHKNYAHCLYEPVLTPKTNVVLAFSLTRLSSDIILCARVLDRTNPGKVLYEGRFVDTPGKDRTLTQAEFEAASGMSVLTQEDESGPPITSFWAAGLHAWQYNFDGKQPGVEATFDNFELWTYRVPIVRYVDANSASPTPPYTNWLTAARVIQDAVDIAVAGDEIIVTNGVYATVGRAAGTNTLVNRVVVDKPLTLRSVNGPQQTFIHGAKALNGGNGPGAVRCVALTDSAVLSGFTLTNGATARVVEGTSFDLSGGGAWCVSTNSVLTNCMITGNTAYADGGGVYGGSLYNCTVAGNSADGRGGGILCGMLDSCTVTGNSAKNGGGSVGGSLNNCIVYFNAAVSSPNYANDQGETARLNHCCTTPLPTNGVGNIDADPLFVNAAASDFHLRYGSPCIDAGTNLLSSVTTDLDGHPRPLDGNGDGIAAFDMGAYEFDPQSVRPAFTRTSCISGNLTLDWNDVARGMKLQRASSLNEPEWQDVPGSIDVSTMTFPLGKATEFFRLVKP